MSNNEIIRSRDGRVDMLEAAMMENMELVDCPLVHLFTPKMYIRQIFMEAGTLLTSRIHNTTHPYCVSMGEVRVQIDLGEWVTIKAPYLGVTQKGTRRVLYILEPTIWQTFHPLDFITGEENDWDEEEKRKLVEKIENMILEPHINAITGTDIHKDYLEAIKQDLITD